LLESSVAARLREKGWTLHSQVGVSSFRIDLGVVDPEAPGRYLAGIECDGATYHRSATARDRDLVRESILRNLGWEILRFWSTDYWIDPEGVVNKLDRQLRQLHAGDRTRA
jgi:very-short-patch-repair endonuclease